MNYSDFLHSVARRSRLPYATVKKVSDALFDVILDTMAEGDDVIIKDFGRFYMMVRKAFTARGFNDGDKPIPESKLLKFKPYAYAKKEAVQRSLEEVNDKRKHDITLKDIERI